MTLRLSTGLRDYVNQGGSIKEALQNGQILIYSGSQPATADTAPSGTLLASITANSGIRTAEVLATGTITLSGTAGTVSAVTVNGVAIIDNAVPFNTSLTQTAADLATEINNTCSAPDYQATSSGAVVTIRPMRNTGAAPNGFVVATTASGGLTAVNANLSGGVTAINGLKWGTSSGGVLAKHPVQVWAGVAANSGTAGWFRFTGSVADSGVTDSVGSEFRLDGAISTSGAQLNMSSTTVSAGATQTISSFPVTLPTS